MSFLDYSNAPADESQQEEWFEEELAKRVNNIKKEFIVSKKKADFDNVLKKYKIKIMKNGKISSPMQLKMDVKKKLLKWRSKNQKMYLIMIIIPKQPSDLVYSS